MSSIMNVQLHSDQAKVPTRGSDLAAGLDLYAAESKVIDPNTHGTINTGVSIELPAGHAGFVWPRSGWANKYGLDTLAGLIDEDYRGEIGVVLANHGTHRITVEVGDRIAQLVVQPYSAVEPNLVSESTDTQRGSSGFGSTGY